MSFKSLPKVELHLHIEGAAPPNFIRGLAQEKSINLDKIFAEDGGYRFAGFAEFLKIYDAACEVLTGPQEFYRLTKAVLEQSAEQSVIYTEMFLSPDFCDGSDLAAWQEYLAAMQEAASEVEQAGGPVMRGVITCIRHLGPEQAKKSALCAAETAGDFITGFGMGGDEMMGSQGDFAYAFDMAREAGLGITTHAGEWGGAASVRDALRDLNPSRIGHGVQSIEDPGLVEELAEKQIMLEVCPGSNVSLGAVSGWSSHPIQNLREAGVRVSVSTDDPPFFHTNLDREYTMLAETFGWEEDTFQQINKDALAAAYVDDITRDSLMKRLET